MSMEMKQKSGDNSQLIQAETVIVNNGITEERARQIFQEESAKITAYTQEAHAVANERMRKLEDSFMNASSKIDGALESFADPAFQLLLRDAAERAAATEREEDYDLLSQLLICHIQKGEERKNRAGIHRAIQIVDEIDNDALCALTVFHAVEVVFPNADNIRDGLLILDRMFSKLAYMELPKGKEWMDHLDILDAIRIDSFGKLKSLKDYYVEMLNGLVCVGIKKDSEDYNTVQSLLWHYQYLDRYLVDNELLDGYVRLKILNEASIDSFRINLPSTKDCPATNIPAPNEVKELLKQVFRMYVKDSTLAAQVKQAFSKVFDEYKHLNKICTWWDSIPNPIEITSVGRVLAHTNAKRCEPSIPDLL